jgi:L-cysteine S-thiosulfotransferase
MMLRLFLLAMALIVLLPLPSAAQANPTPDQDRRHLINILQKRFPALPLEEWSQGTAAISPTLSVTPLGGANATNVNDVLAIGQKQWSRKFKNGKSFADCFPNQGKRAAMLYPQFDETTGMVVTAEMALQRCLSSNNEAMIEARDKLTLGALTAYFRSLSVGQKLAVRVATPAARERYQSGRDWFSRRMGEKDLACASCHVLQAGQIVDGIALSPAVGQVLAWPRIEPGGNVRRLHDQFQLCMVRVGAAPFATNTPQFNDLEYFLSTISSGLTIRPPIPTR